MGIQITTQRASLEIHTTRAKMNLKAMPVRMNMTTVPAKMTIERQIPTFKVNWQKFRNEIGIKSPEELGRSIADDSYQKGVEATAGFVSDGNEMKAIETGVDVVVELSRQATLSGGDYEVNAVAIPKSAPEVEWTDAELNIDWSNFELNIEWDVPPDRIEGEYEPHSVEIKMRNYPNIKITYVDDKSKKIDHKV